MERRITGRLAPKTEEFKKRNAKPWSGGIASVQFNWLKEQVDLAEKEGEKSHRVFAQRISARFCERRHGRFLERWT